MKSYKGEKKLVIQVPTVPNFLKVGDGVGMVLSVKEFTEKELRSVGRQWVEELIKKAKIK